MNAMHAQGEMGSVSWAEEVWDGLVESSLSSLSSSSGWGWQGSQGSPKSRNVENRVKNKDKRDGLGTWRESFLLSERHQSTMLNVEKARNRQYALKMTQILEEEQRLKAIEQKVVDNEKRNARNKAKRLRKTEEERKKRRELLDSLSPMEREKEVERFRKELAERKEVSIGAKAQKSGNAKRYTKEELGEIAGSEWGASATASSWVTEKPPIMSPTPTVSPTSTSRLLSGSTSDAQKKKLDEKRIIMAERSKTRRGRERASYSEEGGKCGRGKAPSQGR